MERDSGLRRAGKSIVPIATNKPIRPRPREAEPFSVLPFGPPKPASPIFAIGAKSRVTCPVSRPAVLPEAVEGFAADSLEHRITVLTGVPGNWQ